MRAMASEISIVCSTICSGANQRKHQSSPSLAVMKGIHRWTVDTSNKGPVTRKVFPFHDVIMFQSTNIYKWFTHYKMNESGEHGTVDVFRSCMMMNKCFPWPFPIGNSYSCTLTVSLVKLCQSAFIHASVEFVNNYNRIAFHPMTEWNHFFSVIHQNGSLRNNTLKKQYTKPKKCT